MARSLAERIRAHEQHKARLAEQEAKLKDAERKVRTRRPIRAGGLVDKAGLFDLDSNARYGAVLSLRNVSTMRSRSPHWAALGGLGLRPRGRARR
jgi:conjugative transfer protein TraD